jgi:Domain of unknown function (DUF4249)
MHLKSRLLIFFLFLQSLSCISPVGDNFAGLPESSVAVWGALNPTVPISVQVARVLTLRDKLTADKVIPDATVELWCNGIKRATLAATGDGIYRSNILPKTGETWTVKVFSTLGNCEASTTIPTPSPILAGSYYNEINILKVDDYERFYPESGFLRIKDTETNKAYMFGYSYYLTLNPSPVEFFLKENTNQGETTYESYRNNAIITDDGFKNTNKDVYIGLSSNSDSVRFILHSLDANLYGLYEAEGRGGKLQITDPNYFDTNFSSLVSFGDPVSAYSNVKGGYGFLGSYSSDSLVVYKRR